MNHLLLASLIAALVWPPVLPDGGTVASGSAESLLHPTPTLRTGVAIARTAPTVDFLYYDCQSYEATGGVWSHWGDGLFANGLFYSSVGDHMSPGGNAFVYAYDPAAKTLRRLMDLRSVLQQPAGHYTPGKIHSEIGLGQDGWLYFSTHRGSTKIASHPTARFQGDWIVRHHPGTGRSEVVAHAPLPMQCLPAGQLDPDRMIFYAGTADGPNAKEPMFLAYDLRNRRVLASRELGPARAMILSRTTGRVYFRPAVDGATKLLRFNPAEPGNFTEIDAAPGLRCATREAVDGSVYTIDGGELWRFDTRTETARSLGEVAVAEKEYIASVDLCPATGRYLYCVPGAHGGSEVDGSPLVQYDLKTGRRKVVCFLAEYCRERYGFIPMGSYGSAVSADGSTVFIVWMGHRAGETRGKLKFDTCALTVVHVPEEERPAN